MTENQVFEARTPGEALWAVRYLGYPVELRPLFPLAPRAFVLHSDRDFDDQIQAALCASVSHEVQVLRVEPTAADRATMAEAGGIAERDLPAGAAEASRNLRLREEKQGITPPPEEAFRIFALNPTPENLAGLYTIYGATAVKRLIRGLLLARAAEVVAQTPAEDNEAEWRQQNGVSRGNVPAPGDKCGHNRCLGTLRATETAHYVRCDRCAVRMGPGPGAAEALETAEYLGRQQGLREGGYEREIDRLTEERDMRVEQIERIHDALGRCDREWTNAHDLGDCNIDEIASLVEQNTWLRGEQEEARTRAASQWEIWEGRRRDVYGEGRQPVAAYVAARTLSEAGDIFCRVVGGVGGAYSFEKVRPTAATEVDGIVVQNLMSAWRCSPETANRAAVLWTSLPR